MKLITENDCPNCKTHYEGELDLETIQKLNVPEKPKTVVKAVKPQAEQEEPEPAQEKVVVKTPAHIPKYKCKDCDKLHDNPNYKTRPRFKCNNCGALNPTAECRFCTKFDEFEELSDEDLDELGIPGAEHKHEHTGDE